MKKVAFTDFRKSASEFFDEVEEGQTIRVYRHGRAIAEIVPPSDEKRAPSWKKSGLKLTVKGASLSRAILEERERGR
ncbi:MAG: type II toxin-antitoxin system Phd/YefM family antitoxin [Deltaproteobacteria bacterium]|nr:type II toxin-antitoxin system Phd/YefM family antitoxin [Deltaproteobacteria bacterium]